MSYYQKSLTDENTKNALKYDNRGIFYMFDFGSNYSNLSIIKKVTRDKVNILINQVLGIYTIYKCY